MFKKHPGKKATDSAESQSNSVQTAGKTDEAEGEFAGLFLCHCSQCGKQTDDVSQLLTSILLTHYISQWRLLL